MASSLTVLVFVSVLLMGAFVRAEHSRRLQRLMHEFDAETPNCVCPLSLTQFQEKGIIGAKGCPLRNPPVLPTYKDRGVQCFWITCDSSQSTQCCYGASNSGRFAHLKVDCDATLIRHTYALEIGEHSWNTAQAICESKYGTHLATIRNKEEQSQAISIAKGHAAWIGFNDKHTDGTFAWVSGDRSTYTAWKSDSPKDLFGEDCAHLYQNGEWGDLNCNHEFGIGITAFLCDKSLPIIPFPFWH